MEARQLLTAAPWHFDFDGGSDSMELTDDVLGARIVTGFRGELDTTYRETNFESAEAAESTLSDIAVDYWDELFGEEVSPALARELGVHSFRYAIGWGSRDADLFSGVAFNSVVADGNVRDATNVRLPGMDQADTAELIDGQLAVVAHDDQVSIFDVRDPANIRTVSQFSVGSGVHQFLTNGDELVVVSSSVDPEIVLDTDRWNIWGNRHWETKSRVRVFDISDPSSVTQTSAIEVLGTIQEARLQDGRLMLSTGGRQDLPAIELVEVEGGEEGQLRFETEEEYLARVSGELVSSVVGQIRTLDDNGEVVSTEDLGGFEDLQILDLADATWGMRHSTMVMLEIENGQLSTVDSEVLLGFSQSFAYANSGSHFAVDSGWGGPSEIVSLSLSDSEIDYRAQGQVDGIIRSAHAMDELDGYLRVFTTRNNWAAAEQGADVWVLGENEGTLEVVGELKDLAEGQGQFGSVFFGDVAYVTTAEFEFRQDIWIADDPLHIIDFSDPTNPIEQSELDIPGVARFLRRVDESHLLGVGFELGDNGTASRQITLYDVSDPLEPQIVRNWVGEEEQSVWAALNETQRGQEMGIRYLPDRGLLTIDDGFARTEVFEIDVNASEPIELVGMIGGEIWLRSGNARSFVLENHVVVTSHNGIATYPLTDLSTPSDEVFLRNPAPHTVYHATGTEHTVSPLDGPHVPESARIISASSGPLNIPISISEDGRRLEFESPADTRDLMGQIEFEWTVDEGTVFTSHVWLQIRNEQVNPGDPVDPIDPGAPPVYSDATVSLGISAVDESGNQVDDVSVGDRIWIELTADRDGFFDNGMFAAYFDVDFDTSVFEVLELENTEPYRNGMRGEVTSDGIRELGGFAGATSPGAGPNTIARFQVEVIGTGDLSFQVEANRGQTAEVLVYGEDERVDPDNVRSAELTLNERSSGEGEFAQTDINHDGITTAIDALILVNALNANANRDAASVQTQSEGEFSMQQMDVNGDSLLTPLDVLQVINELNAAAAEGESGVSGIAATAQNDRVHSVEQVFENDPTDQVDLDALAAAQFMSWDIERRA